ncbi:MAG: aspartate kinase, partial [Bacteroidales bacterium]|nr:aspartate kinase [Bacteroidales bacterium]
MKVLKFGGTSVGSPERMKALPALIVSDEPKIVVLSAMSGTTNNLVEISTFLAQKEYEKASSAIKNLEEKYALVVEELYGTAEYKAKAISALKERFDEIKSITEHTSVGERIILAQG